MLPYVPIQVLLLLLRGLSEVLGRPFSRWAGPFLLLGKPLLCCVPMTLSCTHLVLLGAWWQQLRCVGRHGALLAVAEAKAELHRGAAQKV